MINSARVSMEVSNVSKLVDNLLTGLTNLLIGVIIHLLFSY